MNEKDLMIKSLSEQNDNLLTQVWEQQKQINNLKYKILSLETHILLENTKKDLTSLITPIGKHNDQVDKILFVQWCKENGIDF